MKIIFFLLSLFVFNNHLLASATQVSITPSKAARCDLKDYTLVNTIYNIHKFEDQNELRITFNTSIGSCRDQKIQTLNFLGYQSINMFKEGITFPWSYLPNVEYFQESNDIFKITIIFYKDEAFKKNNVRHFQLAFHPGDFEHSSLIIHKIFREYLGSKTVENRHLSETEYLSNLNFIWNISLEIDNNKNFKLKFNNKYL